MAPPLYATFANGYIYGFVEGTPTAPPQLQLPTVAPLVARRWDLMFRAHFVDLIDA